MAKTLEQDIISNGNLFISPLEFFCGDNVTLSFDFTISEGTAVNLLNSPFIEFKTQEEIAKIINVDEEVFSVNKIQLSAENNNANLKLDCVFWKPENIKLPQVKIQLENEILVINIPEFKVSSILEKTNSTSIRPYKEPEIIPGSTYIFVGEVLLILIAFALILTSLIKIKKIHSFFVKLKQRRIYKKNYKKTIFRLKKLKKLSSLNDDKIYCEKIQNILRDYLAVRFSSNVYNLTTSEIIKWFESIFTKLDPNVAEKTVSLFYEVMNRCDFIRFSGNSIPEKMMGEDEKNLLFENTLQTIDYFEKGIIEC